MQPAQASMSGASVVAAMPNMPAAGVPASSKADHKPARWPASPRPAMSHASQPSTPELRPQAAMGSSRTPSTLSPASAVDAAIKPAMAGGLDQ